MDLPAFILAIVLPFVGAPASSMAVAPSGNSHGRVPAVVENGTDLELFTYPVGAGFPQFTFTPDGSAYAIFNFYYLIKVAPDGTTSFIPIPTRGPVGAQQYGSILYADGYLWFASRFGGYFHMKPDGTNGTFHAQLFSNAVAAPNGIVVSRNDTIEFVNGTTFARTDYAVPHPGITEMGSVRQMILGPDGRLYFEYAPPVGKTAPSDVLARLETNGTFTFFKGRNSCGIPQSGFVNARNAIYFVGGAPNVSARLCRVTYVGTYSSLSAPHFHPPNGFFSNAAADSDGNVWVANVLGAGLYSYATSTGTTSGPYEYGVLDNLGNWVVVGPDQNVWTYGYLATDKPFFGAYVRHLETFTPTSVSLSALDPASDFYVTEPVKSAPWTAYSLNPAIATVSPASSIVGRFKVTSVAAGSTSIVVTDVYGNVRSEPVTVTVGPFP